jgi:hypothetical protein
MWQRALRQTLRINVLGRVGQCVFGRVHVQASREARNLKRTWYVRTDAFATLEGRLLRRQGWQQLWSVPHGPLARVAKG